MFFSQSTHCFYASEIHSALPSDVVEITAEAHSALLAAQTLGKVITVDANGMPVAADPAPPTVLAIWVLIQAERDRRKSAGYLVAGKWFHSDADSRIQQLGLVMLGQNMPPNLRWKTMDGSFVDMTPQLAQQVFAAAAASDIAIFAAAEMHRTAMEASDVPSDYDYSGAWPPVYGEQ